MQPPLSDDRGVLYLIRPPPHLIPGQVLTFHQNCRYTLQKEIITMQNSYSSEQRKLIRLHPYTKEEIFSYSFPDTGRRQRPPCRRRRRIRTAMAERRARIAVPVCIGGRLPQSHRRLLRKKNGRLCCHETDPVLRKAAYHRLQMHDGKGS